MNQDLNNVKEPDLNNQVPNNENPVEPVQPTEPVQNIESQPKFNSQTGAPIYNAPQPTDFMSPMGRQLYEDAQDLSEENPKKKGKGGLIALIIVLVLGLLAGTYFLFGDKIFGDGNSPSSIAKKYVSNLVNKKYENNFDLIKLEKDSYVTVDDYMKYAQSNELYQDIVSNKEYEIKETLLTTTEGTYEVTFKKDDKSKKFTINLVKDEDKWKVKDGNYIKNWSFEVPNGTKVYIGDKEVTEELFQSTSTIVKEHSMCVIPEIARTEKEIRLEHPLAKSTVTVTPKENEQGLFLAPEVTDTELLYAAYTYIKDTFNSMYRDYEKKVKVEDFKTKYFDENIRMEEIEPIYPTAFDTAKLSSVKGLDYSDFNMTEVVPSKNKQTTVYGEDTLLVNFGYRLQWRWWGMDEDMKRLSSIVIRKVDDTFKIYQITDMKLFTWVNQFTTEY